MEDFASNLSPSLETLALESTRQQVRDAIRTGSMTYVLKVFCPHYGKLKSIFEETPGSKAKRLMADILSVLAFTMRAEGERESLKYRLLGCKDDIGSCGLFYVRNLAKEIAEEYATLQEGAEVDHNFMNLVYQIVDFYFKKHAEHEAIDVLMEVDEINYLVTYLELAPPSYKPACLYLLNLAKYIPDPYELWIVLNTVHSIYTLADQYESAIFIALRLGQSSFLDQGLTYCNDLLRKKQICFILAQHRLPFKLDEEMCSPEDINMLQAIINNSKLREGYLTLARDIGLMEPKSPEDIYKTHLIDGRCAGKSVESARKNLAGASVESARQNLAATFVNAFVNAGFGQDKLMTVPSEAPGGGFSTSWLFRNKEHGKASATASLGLIMLWDDQSGFEKIDRYLDSDDTHVAAGALLAIGMFNCNVKNEFDPALAVLSDYVADRQEASIRVCALIGLGLAYAGSRHEQIRENLVQILEDTTAPLDVIVFTAITLGLVFVGSCNKGIAEAIAVSLKDRESELGEPLARLIPLGIGLIYLGSHDRVENEVKDRTNVLEKLPWKIRKHGEMTVISCAYAGTGNVLKVQEFLGQCAQHLKNGETYQGPAVLGIAMVAMDEEVGLEMAIRSLEHLLQYGEQNIRRAVPLALGLLCISNPKDIVMDTLRRLSHDSDMEVSMAAIISLGLIGAGTNNARIAKMLRNLSSHYYNEADLLFCVRIAQGLVHLGKGLLILSPYHSEGFILSPTALAGLLVMLHSCLEGLILGEYHHILYFLSLAMMPRMLMTVDENLEPLSVPVRVGQAVDIAGQAGQPKKITGVRTHTTPILLAAGERAQLATDQYVPVSPILEGFVILRENPEYQDNDH